MTTSSIDFNWLTRASRLKIWWKIASCDCTLTPEIYPWTFLYYRHMTILVLSCSKNPNPGGHEIYNFGRRFIFFKFAVSFNLVSVQVKKKIFKHYTITLTQYDNFGPPCRKKPTLGVMKFTILIEGKMNSVFLSDVQEENRRFLKNWQFWQFLSCT